MTLLHHSVLEISALPKHFFQSTDSTELCHPKLLGPVSGS